MSDSAKRPSTAAHYGDPQAEAHSLRQGCGVIDRSAADRLLLSGEDRSRFLNGQMTCELKGLEPGRGVYGFFTSVKGRIEADAAVLAQEESLLVVLPEGLGVPIRERLERYVIVDRVEIREPEPAARLSFLGPAAPAKLEGILGISPPAETWDHREVTLGQAQGLLVKEGRLGSHAWSLWLPQKEAQALLSGIAGSAEADPAARRVGTDAFEAFRIEAGMSRFGQDFGPENLPQETGIEDAVSYTKGCYLGQEVVARLHYRGQVSRQLRRLEFPDGAPPGVPAELTLDGVNVGEVTSVAAPPGRDGAIGLGRVKRKAFEPGTELEVSTGGRVIVRELPTGP